MEKPLHYLENQFDSATKDNYKKGVELSTYHTDALEKAKETEPLLIPIYNRVKPLSEAYKSEYNKWKSAGGEQGGQTLNLNQLIALAVGRLDTWQPFILTKYAKNTPRYKTMFKDGRKPFTRGSIETRIDAFDSLSINIGADEVLATIKAEVDATYTGLKEARKDQSGAKETLKGGSSDVEKARLAAMNMQYRNMGFIMDIFFDTRFAMANKLFDLKTLRDHQQSIFTGTLTPSETEAVLVHTFMPDDKLRLKSNGPASIKFYLASTPGGIDSIAITVDANQEREVPLSEFNPTDFATHRYVTAVNQSTGETTQYIVEVL